MSDKKNKIIRGSDIDDNYRDADGNTILDLIEKYEEIGRSVRSIAFAKIIDLISEGEIEGLVDGYKSVYFDDTPVQNADLSYNFSNFLPLSAPDIRTGTQNQTYISGFELVENTVVVGTEILQNTPVTRTISDAEVDAVRVVFQFPALFQTVGAETQGVEVEIKIELQSNGGGYNTILQKFIRGKSTNAYEKEFRVELTGSSPWDIRLSRLTPDSTDITLQNKTYWGNYTEIVDSKLRYPNSAIIAHKIDSAQFSSIPRRSYDIKGVKVRVPSNYNPVTKVYTGIWDGTFSAPVYTANPVWCLMDILTSERYGLGKFISDSQIDIWSLYEISQYCDEMVPNGSGGFESRFELNAYFQTQEEVFKVINDLSSVFRGMAYAANGSITLTQDAPKDSEYLFSNANVVEGIFTYSGASSKARHTVAIVSYIDPENGYKPALEYVEDQEAVAKYGIITTSVLAFGCTSRGQANRVGRWLLYTEQYESRVVIFRTGTEGVILRPGMVIQVADDLVAGARIGGRIAAATTTTVTIDNDYAANPVGGDISVVLPSGAVETRVINAKAGRVITVATPFSSAPATPSMWMISTSTLETQLFRVISVSEESNGIFAVSAIFHDPSKYAAIETGLELEQRTITTLTPLLFAPTNLQLEEALFESSGTVRTKVTFSWDLVKGATSYQVKYQRGFNNPILLPPQISNEIEVFDVVADTYTFSVICINSLGKRSQPATIEQELYGKVAPPTDVIGFSVLPSISNQANVTWDKATDLDVLIGGKVRLRWSPLVAPSWNDCVDIIPALAGIATNASVPLLEGTYLAKFEDSSGNESVNAVGIYTSVPYGNLVNVVETLTEDTTFLGRKNNCEIDGTGLILTNSSLVGTYNFNNAPDLGAVYPCRITAYIDVAGFVIEDLFDSRTDLIDDWESFDGAEVGDATVKLLLRSTEDNPIPQVTRSTTGTYFNEFGVMQSAAINVYRPDYNPENVRTNLLTRSQDFTHANWQVGGTANYTRTANVIKSPIGSMTADSLVVNVGVTSLSSSTASQTLAKTASVTTYTESVYVKDKGAGGLRFRIFFDAAVANACTFLVNLETGVILSTTSVGTITGGTSTITALANGWYRVTITVNSDSSTILRRQIFPATNTGASFTGDGVKGIYLWGAQCEEASAVTAYIPTTTAAATATTSTEVILAEAAATNLFLQSQDLTSAVNWQVGGTVNYTRTANTTVAPDGTTTADTMTPVIGVSSFNSSCPTQEVAKAASVITYTTSVYVKDNGAGAVRIRTYFDAGAANTHSTNINLNTGVVEGLFSSGTVSGASVVVQKLPNKWFRISLTGASDTSLIVRTQIHAYAPLAVAFTGDGVRGIYVWGAQLEATAAATTYIPTTVAAVTRGLETITSTPAFTDWKPFFIGEYTGRSFQFRADLSVVDANHNVKINELEVIIDMPDRTESQLSLVSGAGTYNAVFPSAFRVTPGIVISAHNMATGDYYAITSQSATGFSIVFRNAAGTAISRTFDYVAKGYGRKI